MSWCNFSHFLRTIPRRSTLRLACDFAALVFCFAHSITFAGEPLQLTHDGTVKTDPVFVDRTGNELLYGVNDLPTRMRLMKLKLADKSVSPLHADETRAEFEAAFSADGQWITFLQSRGNLSLAVVVQELATRKEFSAILGGGFSGARSPAFTPDGKRVVYSYADEGLQRIYSANIDLSDQRILIESTGVNNWPSFSPDGKRLLFGSSRDDDFEIYVSHADGSAPQRLTSQPRQDIRPRWSPDGKQIAFTSAREGNYEIYVMNADGSQVRRVTNHPERDDYAAWHPDGQRLVIVSERRGKHDLWLVDVPRGEARE